MTEIFLDIENTVIDSLFDNNFMQDNCERIKQFILKSKPSKVNIFTWGWKNKSEIKLYIVDAIFDKLEIPAEQRGRIIVKEDSVRTAIKVGWLHEEDASFAIEPGMMQEFGISKVSCFIEMVTAIKDIDIKEQNLEIILIDDLVDEDEELTYFGGKQKVKLLNPVRL